MSENGSSSASEALTHLTARDVADAVRRHPWLVACGFVLGVSAAVLLLARSSPSYRASALVRLEEAGGSGGVLGELSLLSKAPPATAEIAVLTSRTLAEQVVERSEQRDAAQAAPGLATRVDDLGRAPLARFLGRGPAPFMPRVRTLEVGNGAPTDCRLEFTGEDQVRLTDLAGEQDPASFELGPSRTLDYAGLKIAVEEFPVHGGETGSLVGHTFQLSVQGQDPAAIRLRGAVRAVETTRNSGVISLTVTDSDPERAAFAANALVESYLARRINRGRERASQTVEFIERQLESQREGLETAESDVVRLRAQHPELIDLEGSASAIVEEITELSRAKLELEIAREAGTEAIALLGEGRIDGLGRLGSNLSDPLAAGLVESLQTLELQRLMADHPDGGPARERLAAHLLGLEVRADELELERSGLREVLERLETGDTAALSMLGTSPENGLSTDPITLAYLGELAELENEAARLTQTLTEKHPELLRVREAIDGARERITAHLAGRLTGLEQIAQARADRVAEARAALTNLPKDSRRILDETLAATAERTRTHLSQRHDQTGAELAEIQSRLERAEQRLADLPERQRELTDPLRRLEMHTELVTFLLRSLQEAQIARAANLAGADVIDVAKPPRRRYAPRLSVTLLLGALAGCGLGLFAALARERSRDAIFSGSELEATSGLPILATIPDFTSGRTRVRGAGKQFVAVRDAPRGPVAEAYRSLRANLRFALESGDPRTVAVTSCAPGEGKSTANVDLAWALASGGRRVCLVDADLRRPSVHRYLDLDPAAGVAEVLHQGADWRGLVRATQLPGLDVLTAGELGGRGGELFDGERAGELVAELREEYDRVVFDLPPAGVVADVEGFAHALDGVILLYRSGGLSREALRTTLARLRQAGVQILGAVLNASRTETTRSGSYGNAYYTDSSPIEPQETRRRA